MILGVGVDLCHVERIRRSVRRYGDLWLGHVFSPDEQRLYAAHTDPVLAYARGFCGKEACAKALGTGFAEGLDWREIGFLQGDAIGVRVSGMAAARMAALTPPGHAASFAASCGGDRLLAQAFVILSAEPVG